MRTSAFAFTFFSLLCCCDRSSPAPTQTKAAPSASSTQKAGVRVLDAGKEPRFHPTFAFVAGRRETARMVLDSHLDRSGQPVADEHVEITLDVTYPAKDKAELVVRRATSTATDIRNVGTTVGTRFVQKIYETGEIEPPEVSYPTGVDELAGDYIRGAVVQVASNFLPLMPKEPVGPGARWELRDLRFVLVERSERASVFRVERRGGYQGERQTPMGTMAMAVEEQLYTMDAVADGLARRVDADLVSEFPPGSKRRTQIHFEIDAP